MFQALLPLLTNPKALAAGASLATDIGGKIFGGKAKKKQEEKTRQLEGQALAQRLAGFQAQRDILGQQKSKEDILAQQARKTFARKARNVAGQSEATASRRGQKGTPEFASIQKDLSEKLMQSADALAAKQQASAQESEEKRQYSLADIAGQEAAAKAGLTRTRAERSLADRRAAELGKMFGGASKFFAGRAAKDKPFGFFTDLWKKKKLGKVQ
jgi:hypothetical protein